MILDLTIGDLTIDCANAERARDFYADLMGWEKTTAFGSLAVKTDKGMTFLFWEPDMPYAPPVWPEEPGKQQKQIHLDFTVDDVPSAVEKAICLGATKASMQYGGESCITMLDTEAHPFCFCKRQSEAEFGVHFEQKYYSELADYSINIDCPDTKILREFYAGLTNWDQEFHWTALVSENGMNVHFMQSDFDYIPPVWPEEPGKQQKQMHFNFQVSDLPSAVEETIKLGATKSATQYGGEHFVTMLDPVGHPFCLCRR
ncbi:MAG: VOC family protein [Oscillospiraceae bacterium]|nr:VOC family protein [Oscillospiraceae bacterium]MDD4414770.1 VOC family protein [Oscillospiraceae bacterium]